MGKNRLEAFSDGVIAIIITIMVLELKVPHGETLESLTPLVPVFLSYVLSFLYVGIYWNNHHHMLHACTRVTARCCGRTCICCSGCRSFPSPPAGWVRITSRRCPAALYGLVLLMAAIAYWVLQQAIIASEGPASILRSAVGRDWKGKLSPLLYIAAIASTFWVSASWMALVIYAGAAIIWFVPDPRIEHALQHKDG